MAATADGRSSAFRVLLRMQIRPGMEPDFERAWHAVGTAVTGHPANLGQWLSRSAEEDGVYYVQSDWTDEASFREFEASERHRAHRERLYPYRCGGAMTTMHVVRAMARATAN